MNSGEQHATAIRLVEREYAGWNSILKTSKDLKVRKRNGALPASLGV